MFKKSPEPMNIYEAIEVMKIIEPHIAVMKEHKQLNCVIKALVQGFQKTRTNENSFRLIALMYHVDLQKVIEYFQSGATGKDMFELLINGFIVNPLADLINGCNIVGLTELEWSDARE